MASSSPPEPVVVLYKSSACRHCQNLTNIWDSVTLALKKVYPKLRFHVLSAKDNTGKFDENTAPKDLIRYGKWFPMILLVPGKIWDVAMANLGPKNPFEIKDGVQMLNASWDNGELKFVQKYDLRKVEDLVRWLQDSLENEDFKRVQFGNGLSVPITTTSSQPIQPLMNGIVRPTNSAVNYVAAGPERQTSMEPGTKTPSDLGDVCSMRIISRPR